MFATVFAVTLLAAPGHPARALHHRDPATWSIDRGHSEVTFRIRHFMTKVRGRFTDWDGTITGDPRDWSTGSVSVAIRSASINTANDQRDADLRSPRFFSVDTFPEITFKSSKVEVSGESVTITGDLTMRGVTRPVVLTGSYLGALGNKVGFEASTTINRTDYGITWNRAVEGGGVMLGDDVEVSVSIEANKR